MPFAQDRDLLALHPTLFREVSFLAQTLFRGTVQIASGQLTLSTGSFPASIQPGHVAVIDDRPVEIIGITGSTSLAVSLLRAAPDGPAITPPNIAPSPGLIATFDPQIAIIHAQVLRMLALEPAQQMLDPLAPGEAAVLNPRDLAPAEALGALHLVYSAAAAPIGAGTLLGGRATDFAERFARERWRARAIIDTDGDGRADAVRTLNITHLSR
jgi:hypothetical protein